MYDSIEYRQAFVNYMFGKELSNEQRTVLQTNVGGTIVSKPIADQIQAKLKQLSPIRQLARVFSVNGQFSINLGNNGATASLVAENGTISETNTTLTSISFGAYKIACIVKLSNELEFDSLGGFESYLSDVISIAISEVEGNLFINGTGTGQPQGVINVTNTVTDLLTQQGLAKVYTKVNSKYRSNSTWLVSDATYLKLASMPEFIDSLSRGLLFGRPVLVDPNIPADKLVFGDFLRGYAIIDRNEMPYKYSQHRNIDIDVLTIMTNRRTDARIVDNDALVVATLT